MTLLGLGDESISVRTLLFKEPDQPGDEGDITCLVLYRKPTTDHFHSSHTSPLEIEEGARTARTAPPPAGSDMRSDSAQGYRVRVVRSG